MYGDSHYVPLDVCAALISYRKHEDGNNFNAGVGPYLDEYMPGFDTQTLQQESSDPDDTDPSDASSNFVDNDDSDCPFCNESASDSQSSASEDMSEGCSESDVSEDSDE